MRPEKFCFVPTCYNRSKRETSKTYVHVPSNEIRRRNWFLAIFGAKAHVTKTSSLYVCEDHFNLQEDAENYMRYKMCGTKLMMRYDIVPHRNLERTVKEEVEEEVSSQFMLSSQEIKTEDIDSFEYENKLFDNFSSNSTQLALSLTHIKSETEDLDIEENIDSFECEIEVLNNFSIKSEEEDIDTAQHIDSLECRTKLLDYFSSTSTQLMQSITPTKSEIDIDENIDSFEDTNFFDNSLSTSTQLLQSTVPIKSEIDDIDIEQHFDTYI